MSDVKAAAAARRAKILAKEKDRLLAAKGEGKFESDTPTDAAEAALKKERPLAARQRKIASMASTKATLDPDATSAITGGEKPMESPKKKTIEEINADVMKNTATFDATYKKEDKDVPVAKKVQEKVKAVMPTSTLMSLVRLTLLSLLGAFVGYRSALSEESKHEMYLMKTNSKEVDSVAIETKKMLGRISGTEDNLIRYNGNDYAFSAVGLLEFGLCGTIIVWFLAYLLKGPLEKAIGTKSPNSSGIISLLLSIYNNGFTPIFEGLLTSVAEIILYMLVVISAGALTSFFTSDAPTFEPIVNEL